ncbi:GNAT family N-acetyltransferase [Phyllobacterium myrsinacearum]|uniref:Ribosomal protein S18 acetylase RimI-like enzyme n=1 Tax=Phyllobacterium myrsinacearum TaxID=28101 RepID=A0A839EU48_9HYPH|nr:GNAT family N-acetyltransferase [Phyllobacterium myrsinacearum]MBA8881024.1 ribosomal protein S18 acetylase RimI-like enzyme [Phyllobacterium myrsinacearum]
MISFRPMDENEFEGYRDYFIPDYAAEISANYDLSESDALAQARREIEVDLPNGPQTQSQTLVCIIENRAGSDGIIGYLWYHVDPAASSAFIHDFYVFPHLQGKGFGKAALSALQATLADEGIQHLRLRVAGNNDRARHLYESDGFRLTGFNMSKRIGSG